MNGFQGNESSESIGSLGRTLPGQVVLVLQGGGALGSYQAGVYQALHEAGIEPDWIIGTSIGAINASLIAGNVPQERVSRLAGILEAGGAASDLEFSGRLSGHQRNAVLLVNGGERDSRFLQTQSARPCRRGLSDRYR
jgi:Predicted esterase of the alpha-beta hydrolase superfamily